MCALPPEKLAERYRQTGECTVDGVTNASDGEGSGTGTVSGNQFTLTVNGCTYRGRMRSADAFTASVSCPVTQPGSARWNVEGSLEARRAQPRRGRTRKARRKPGRSSLQFSAALRSSALSA